MLVQGNLAEPIGEQGIMSAINFSADVQKKTTDAGERVVITFNGKVCVVVYRTFGFVDFYLG